jgi:hypothetical protein
MTVEALLSRLDGVRHTGDGRWLARCPGHDDRRPSLRIRELEDGRVLVHDFAGCSTEEVLAAVGLDFDALFPEQPVYHRGKRERRPFNAIDVLRALRFELTVAVIHLADVRDAKAVSDVDHERFLLAVERISRGAELGGV